MNQIERNVFVLEDRYKPPIDYVRFTNAIPLVFNFQDYTIPSGASAKVFCAKPSGMAVYSAATISENSVAVDVSDQMFIEIGKTEVQVEITSGSDTLVTFAWPVNVKPNYTQGDIPPSQNENGFFEQAQEAINNANSAAESANQAAQNVQNAVTAATEAAESANQAAESANEAANGVDEAVQNAVAQEKINAAVNAYLESNPISVNTTPTLSSTGVLTFPVGNLSIVTTS